MRRPPDGCEASQMPGCARREKGRQPGGVLKLCPDPGPTRHELALTGGRSVRYQGGAGQIDDGGHMTSARRAAKYTEYVTAERELYDEDADPFELTNVVD